MQQVIPEYHPSERQAEASSLPDRFKLYGGAVGGGKTYWLCFEAIRQCLLYPGNVVFLFREELASFKITTLVTLLKLLPDRYCKTTWNKTENYIDFTNGSRIYGRGFAETRNLNKQKKGSLECGMFGIDEAHETRREDFLFMQSRLRWKLPDGTRPPYYGLLCTNPADCWLKEDFVEKETRRKGYVFVKALPSDNPHLPDDYVDQLKENYPAEWVTRYLLGDWSIMLDGLIINPELVNASVNKEVVILGDISVGCDVARSSGMNADETSIYVMHGGRVMDSMHYKGQDTQVTAANCLRMYKQYNAKRLLIDDIGVGAGVSDACIKMGLNVIKIVANSRSSDRDKFKMLKDEMWWYARTEFEQGKISIPNDPILKRQLGTVKYEAVGRSIQVESKAKIKERNGWSPDRADALVMAIWGGRFSNSIQAEYWRSQDEQEAFPEYRPTDRFSWNNNRYDPLAIGVRLN